jgi:hypothetical protein
MEKICETCGKTFFVTPSIAELRKNCSRECHYKGRSPQLPPLNDRQQSILLGSLLGDGHLEVPQKITHNSRFRKSQKIDNYDYQHSLFLELGDYARSIKQYSKKRMLNKKVYTEKEWTVYSASHPSFTELRNKWYREEKIVPEDIKLTPLALAYWFCDDGYIGGKENNATICTHSFTKTEVEMLSSFLQRDLEIKSSVRRDRVGSDGEEQYVIYIGSNQYEHFLNIITEHVPWSCMSHKLTYTQKQWKWSTKA